MAQRLALGQLRVQKVRHRDGRCSYTVFDSSSGLHSGADWYLSQYAGKGSDRTYAYLLVDHLRWLEHEGLTPETVVFRDLKRYMGAVGAKIPMPYGAPWRVGKRPYENSALRGAAACLKGFYLRLAELGINTALAQELKLKRMPTQRDKDRALLGHLKRSMDANPLAPKEEKRRHKKMLPDGAREVLLEEVNSARDRVVVEWLSDGGFRIGELCGLHLAWAQREQIAELLGQIRDLQTEWSQEDITRIITDNGALKKQVRELSAQSKSLTSKLAAARENIRFADKRIADLEVRLADASQLSKHADASTS